MRQIRNLKFLGHPMVPCDYGFWILFHRIGLRVQVYVGKNCVPFTVVRLRGMRVLLQTASGTIAARNKAERWFRKWAADVGEIAKGKP